LRSVSNAKAVEAARHAAFRSLLGITADHAPLTYKMLISPEAKT
jgi:hypothetical protein